MAHVLTSDAAAEMLSGCGVPLAQSVVVTSAEAAAHFVNAGQSYAFKIVSPDIAHKSDIGGVRLGIKTKEEAKTAYADITTAVAAALPQARLEGVEIQPMAPEGVELVFGYSHQRSFGPVVMLGYGGIFVELIGGAQFAAAPVSLAQATAMLDALPAQALLDGARGRPPVNRQAVAQAFADFSAHVARNAATLEEVDLNPVIATSDRLIAVDWLVSAAQQELDT